MTFDKWYRDNEKRFHDVNFTEKEVAHSAYDAGERDYKQKVKAAWDKCLMKGKEASEKTNNPEYASFASELFYIFKLEEAK